MQPLDLGVIGGTANTCKVDLDAQHDEPQMQMGREGRSSGVIVKDRASIKRQAFGEAERQKSTA
jgi:hypothetical protein